MDEEGNRENRMNRIEEENWDERAKEMNMKI
jgi:hypothetical protein